MTNRLSAAQSQAGREIVVHNGSRHSPTLLYLEPVGGDVESDPREGKTILDYWLLIRSRLPWILTLGLLTMLAGAVFTVFQVPIYQSYTSLELQNLNENMLNIGIGQIDNGNGMFSPETYIQTQVKILYSDSLRHRAIDKLRQQNPGRVYYSEDRLWTWRKVLGLPLPPKPPGQRLPGMPSVVVQIKPVAGSRILEILCDSPDAVYASEFANEMANQYIESTLESRWAAAQRTTTWLARQIEDLRRELRASEERLQEYSRQEGLVFTTDKESNDQVRLEQIQEEVSKAQADRILKQAAYEVAQSASAESVPMVLDNERLNDSRTKLADLRRDLAELRSIYKPEHYRVKRVEAQIAQVEQTVQQERQSILARIKNDYDASVNREKLLVAALSAQSQVVFDQSNKSVNYNLLKRDVEANRGLYDALLEKVKEAGILSALRATTSRVVDAAKPAVLPYKPSILPNGAMGLVLGLMVGSFLVLVRDGFDHSLKAPGEASFHLKIPELGVIPAQDVRHRHNKNALLSLNGTNGNGLPAEQTVELVTWQDKPSLIAESFRNVLASVLASSPRNAAQVIMVSSALRGEGKSMMVSNLGIALAEINLRALLIDADMRKPRLNQIFGLPNSWGLSDLLREKHSIADHPLEALVRRTEIDGLSVIPSGPGTISISNLLYSQRLEELIERLRREFDIILIDTPPMTYISDARLLGRLADSAILVIRLGHTTRDIALHAKQRLAQDGIPLLGTVLNGWNPKSRARYGYSDYSPYYDSYYTESSNR